MSAGVGVDGRIAELLALGAATVHEASGGGGALPHELRPVHPLALAGRALPVRCPPGDNLALHEALDVAAPGEVIVATCGDAVDHGYWGEVMAVAALARGLAGLVIEGCVRDSAALAALGFPVYARGLCVRGTGKDAAASRSVGDPVQFGDVTVRRGDAVIGDGDGVVVVAAADVDAVRGAARRRAEREQEQFAQLRAGATTMDLLGLRPDGGT
ncbi:MAG: hypothetical protein ABT15_22760 [Pseudonocardia sp. SCN 73-27]|uniref:RraA family protein n=1 Tax=unclassified Pseudonocardia TaxID=2619320 RepID=UPI00086BE2A5|nr:MULTISPECIES: RraA family protein [unclassified Pseudonocardia]ODU29785.1 MAG: hypothetical protein ABS80_01335 [Pseudonocardia sp. SCN 72-51]ODV03456.1 MAG: hypothetical protein ABT15_22760 [Pseudonocardia sp. SCN 73-27]